MSTTSQARFPKISGQTELTSRAIYYPYAYKLNKVLLKQIRSLCIGLADFTAFCVSFSLAWGVAGLAAAVFWPEIGFFIDPAQLWYLLAKSSVAFAGVFLYLTAHGHYSRRVPFWSELQRLVGASTIALLCSSFVEFSLQSKPSRLLLVGTWIIFPFAAASGRQLVRCLLSHLGLWQIPVVIVGAGEAAQQARAALMSEWGLGYEIVDVVDPTSLDDIRAEWRWRYVLQRAGAQLLVVAVTAGDLSGQGVADELVRQRVPFAVMPRSDGLPVLGCEWTAFFTHETVMVSFRNNLEQPLARLAKIAFDLIVALLMLAVLAPLMLLIAVSVKLDGGPVFFAHPRIGARGHVFKCLKFRTMAVDSEAVLERMLSEPAVALEWAQTQKLRRDPRVTRVGTLLRKLSLDELPQLFNVLRLEMSLVGPRPIVQQEARHYRDNISYYYETRPGLTGLWQVSGRSDTSYAQRVQLDTWYVKNWTIWHDLAILAKTVPAVLKRRGAV